MFSILSSTDYIRFPANLEENLPKYIRVMFVKGTSVNGDILEIPLQSTHKDSRLVSRSKSKKLLRCPIKFPPKLILLLLFEYPILSYLRFLTVAFFKGSTEAISFPTI